MGTTKVTKHTKKISYVDHEDPNARQGGLPIAYRVGPGPATVRMRLRMDDRVRPIWTVIHLWMSRFGDPTFRYHAAMAQLWGVMALRLGNADALPLDYRPYASRVIEFLDGLAQPSASVALARAAAVRFQQAAAVMAGRIEAALSRPVGGEPDELARLNRSLMRAERALIDEAGLPGRPWYRHQIYAPKYTYAPEVLPGIAEAVAARDPERLRTQVGRLAAALDRAGKELTPGSRDQ